jgi:hypothetical protein
MWGACGVHVGCMWGACGVHVGCMWGACGVHVGCLWGRTSKRKSSKLEGTRLKRRRYRSLRFFVLAFNPHMASSKQSKQSKQSKLSKQSKQSKQS